MRWLVTGTAFVLAACAVVNPARGAVPDLTPETRAFFRNLRELPERGRYVFAWNPWVRPLAEARKPDGHGGWVARAPDEFELPSAVRTLTGEEPILYFGELWYVAGTYLGEEAYAQNRASIRAVVLKAWHDYRAVPVFSWHPENPYVPSAWKERPYRYRYVSEGADPAHRYVFREILEDGGAPCGGGRAKGCPSSAAPDALVKPRAWYEARLGEIASFVNGLKDEKGVRIPVVIRLFHECEDDWAWWGAKSVSTADYVRLFRHSVDRLRELTDGGRNVLFAYSPDRYWWVLGKEGDGQAYSFMSRYPGDGYVDIIGYDDYGIGAGTNEQVAVANQEAALRKMRNVTMVARERGKACGLFETGAIGGARPDSYDWLHRLMTARGNGFAFVNLWGGYEIPRTDEGKRCLARFVKHPEVLTFRDGVDLTVPLRAAAPMSDVSAPSQPFRVLDLPPGEGNCRNSEGDFAVLKNGDVLFVYTHFTKGRGGDADPAKLCSRVSKDGGRTWSAQSVDVVPNEGGQNVMCPALLRLKDGALALFYLVKNSDEDCRPVLRVSRDDGRTWSAPTKVIPDSEIGYYVFENCRAERLPGGRIILPMTYHASKDGRIVDYPGKLVCWFSDDEGLTWRRGVEPFAAYDAAGNRLTLQEPGIVPLKDGRLYLYARTRHGRQWCFHSSDRGETWSAGRPSALMGPNSPATLKRLSNGDILAVWNDHTRHPEFACRDLKAGIRRPMSVAISRDEGLTWSHRKVLEDADAFPHYCYFGVLEHRGNVLVSFCAKDDLRHTRIVAVPLAWIYAGEDPEDRGNSFRRIPEGPVFAVSTIQGTWTAKPDQAEIRGWKHGRGLRLYGGSSHEVFLELPPGTRLDDLGLLAERNSAKPPYDFRIDGRRADGTWQRLVTQGADTPAGELLPLKFPRVEGEIEVLRFTCLSEAGTYLRD